MKTRLSLFAGIFLVAFAFSDQNPPQQRMGQLVCCNIMINVPAGPKWIAGASTECREYLSQATPDVQLEACRALGPSGLVCVESAAFCRKESHPPDEKPCPQKYSGEISCDCDADGEYETTKNFEACGKPSSFAPTFKSKCEDWVTKEGFGYPTDLQIQRAGADYLENLKPNCPSLKCYPDYVSCEQAAKEKYDKCTFGKNYVGVNRNCLRNMNVASEQCKQTRDDCLNRVRRGPEATPQPLPTPPPAATPTAL